MINSIQDGLVALVVSSVVATGGFLLKHDRDIALHSEAIKNTRVMLEVATATQKELIDGVHDIQLNNAKWDAELNLRLSLLENQDE